MMWNIGFSLHPRDWHFTFGGPAWDTVFGVPTVVGRVWALGPVAIFHLHTVGDSK